MNNLFNPLHKIDYKEEIVKGELLHTAKISHVGIGQLRAKKSITSSKSLKNKSRQLLDVQIADQFEKWDKKWSGAFPGPHCSYDANTPTSPTGFTWRELEAHRNKMRIDYLASKGIFEYDDMMLFTKKIPLYNDFFDINYPKTIEKMTGLDFVAIDFETANEKSTSVCSLGLVKVVDGEIVSEHHWYINPVPFVMNPINEGIHGISLYKLTTAPTFDKIWPDVHSLIKNQLVVAHNCSFDFDKLNSILSYYSIDFESPESFCTMSAYKHFWPNSSSSLSNVSQIFGIELDHHEALSDARACASIAIKLARLNNITNLKDLFSGIRSNVVTPKKESNENYFRTKNISGVDVEIDFASYDPLDPTIWNWSGKRVVVSGIFEKYERDEMVNKLKSLGANVSTSISKITDILLVGGTNIGPSKLTRAKEFNVRLMSEDEFENLLK